MVAESANMSIAQLAAASKGGLIGGAAGILPNATQPFLFVGVLTHPNSTERRRAVRETWMAAASPEVDYKFVHYQARSFSVYPAHIQLGSAVSGIRIRWSLNSPALQDCSADDMAVRARDCASIQTPRPNVNTCLRLAAMLTTSRFLSEARFVFQYT